MIHSIFHRCAPREFSVLSIASPLCKFVTRERREDGRQLHGRQRQNVGCRHLWVAGLLPSTMDFCNSQCQVSLEGLAKVKAGKPAVIFFHTTADWKNSKNCTWTFSLPVFGKPSILCFKIQRFVDTESPAMKISENVRPSTSKTEGRRADRPWANKLGAPPNLGGWKDLSYHLEIS